MLASLILVGTLNTEVFNQFLKVGLHWNELNVRLIAVSTLVFLFNGAFKAENDIAAIRTGPWPLHGSHDGVTNATLGQIQESLGLIKKCLLDTFSWAWSLLDKRQTSVFSCLVESGGEVNFVLVDVELVHCVSLFCWKVIMYFCIII